MKSVIIILGILHTLVCFGTPTKVTRIIDGDTFQTETGEKVRLIGINAPEISDIFGEEAKTHLSELIEDQFIELVSDNISHDRDRYNRLLRYVMIKGIDINKKMIADGYAFAYLKYKFHKAKEYNQAQLEATKNDSGMWRGSKDEEITKQQGAKSSILASFLAKEFVIAGLILLIVVIGAFYYFTK